MSVKFDQSNGIFVRLCNPSISKKEFKQLLYTLSGSVKESAVLFGNNRSTVLPLGLLNGLDKQQMSEGHTDRQLDRQTDRQAVRQTDRQTGRQAVRQTDS